MKIPMPAWLADAIINHAKKRPFKNLGDYMHRFWFVAPTDRLARLLTRYRCQWRDARVHEIRQSDKDRDLHDHPWPWFRIILKNGYTEVTHHGSFGEAMSWVAKEGKTFDQKVVEAIQYNTRARKWEVAIYYGPGDVAYRPANFYHRLVVEPGEVAVTLFVMGANRDDKWGFMTPDGKIPWDEYLDEEEVTRQRAAIKQAYEEKEKA